MKADSRGTDRQREGPISGVPSVTAPLYEVHNLADVEHREKVAGIGG